MPLDFDGFNATARYWKLLILNNHGSHQTSFHGIEFYGYDTRISKLIDQLNLNEYEDLFIENVIKFDQKYFYIYSFDSLKDMNQIEAIVNCTRDQFERIVILRLCQILFLF